ncbi:MAG: DUF2179 domain-containing protein [Phycisphaerae bacterium]|nr:DUF2179 domain-containing protein [Phycisphaerae bacterium]
MEAIIFNANTMTWVVIPVLIFLARIVDVTIGTARVIFVSRGYKLLAAATGFFEVLIWLLAIGQIMKNLSNPMCYIAYASGFALGNYIGITLAEKMSLGTVLIQVMTNRDPSNLINALKEKEYGVTTVQAQGAFNPVKLVFTIVPRKHMNEVLSIIQKHNPKSFYTTQEIASIAKGFFPSRKGIGGIRFTSLFKPFRKGK